MEIKYKFEAVAVTSGLFVLLTVYALPVATYFEVITFIPFVPRTPNLTVRPTTSVIMFCFTSLLKRDLVNFDASARVEIESPGVVLFRLARL